MCHGLEYLSLDESILNAFTAQIHSLLSTGPLRYTMPGPIVFPRLRTLQLIGHPDAIFHILTTTHAPQDSGVGVWSRLMMSPSYFHARPRPQSLATLPIPVLAPRNNPQLLARNAFKAVTQVQTREGKSVLHC